MSLPPPSQALPPPSELLFFLFSHMSRSPTVVLLGPLLSICDVLARTPIPFLIIFSAFLFSITRLLGFSFIDGEYRYAS